MGEVYLAEDTRLGREVAIKVLPEIFTKDPERLARFEREARMLAALDHPNIAAIFDVDEADETHFLVMQLAGGETLAEKIKQGPIPVDKSLEIARQIAEALEYAHAKGIIHRDLKPANVMVAVDGQVKVLDFGLAKALEQNAENLENSTLLSASPTLTRDMTREGVILGTAAYMSPEQAKGEVVDEQADIWAFGCVLYEMLTGHRANPGNSSAEVIAKILEAEPIWGALPAQTPVGIRRLLRRCLAKEPKHRLQSIADARIEIEEAGDPVDEPELAAPLVTARPLWLSTAPWVLSLLLVIVALAQFLQKDERGLEPTTRFSMPGHKLALGTHPVAPIVAISADGSLMAYIEGEGDSGQLYLRRMDSFESIAIEGADEAQSPFFSPDSRWLGFAADGKMKKVSVDGGSPQEICDIEVLHGATWADDGTIVFNTADGLMRVPETGGEQQVVTTEDAERNEVGHHTPQLLANGNVIFTTVGGGADPLEVVLYSPATGDRRTLMQGGSNALYLPTGHLLWAADNALLAAPLDLESGTLGGSPIPVVKEVIMGFASEPGRAHFAASQNGPLRYVSGPPSSSRADLVRSWPSTREVELGSGFTILTGAQFSPDGRKVVLSGTEENRDEEKVWVLDLNRDTWTLITRAEGWWPAWSPDGTRVAFSSRTDDEGPRIWWAPADGSSQPEVLLESYGAVTSWTPDGRYVLAQLLEPNVGWDIALLDITGDQDAKFLLAEDFFEYKPRLSRDGRWLAYVSNESGRSDVFVRSYPDLARRWQISNQGGDDPQWSADGSELYFRENQRIMRVPISTTPEFSPGIAEAYLDLSGPNSRKMTTSLDRSFDVAPDGTSVVFSAEAPPNPDEIELRVVLNWFPALERLVPIR